MITTAHSPSLSRTPSALSIASDDTLVAIETADSQKEKILSLQDLVLFVSDEPSTSDEVTPAPEKVPRTRRRFSNEQLILLEHLFHEATHPSRQQRDRVAEEGNMEPRSVTIWFQNKRQSERRARNMRTAARRTKSSPTPSSSSDSSRTTLSAIRNARSRASVHARSSLSLDDVVASVERRHLPTTPRRKTLSLPTFPSTPYDSSDRRASALYDTMLSSPMSSCQSCKDREHKVDRAHVDLGKEHAKTMRTLEWACAAARIDGRVGGEKEMQEEDLVLDLGGDTDTEDVHEAVTPKSARALRDNSEDPHNGKKQACKENMPADAALGKRVKFPSREDTIEERDNLREDEMDVALVLAGLGRA